VQFVLCVVMQSFLDSCLVCVCYFFVVLFFLLLNFPVTIVYVIIEVIFI
jgi:hypothetical protein